MQSEEREKIRKQAVTLIRSLLISTKGGVPIEKMSRKLFIFKLSTLRSLINKHARLFCFQEEILSSRCFLNTFYRQAAPNFTH